MSGWNAELTRTARLVQHARTVQTDIDKGDGFILAIGNGPGYIKLSDCPLANEKQGQKRKILNELAGVPNRQWIKFAL